MNTDTYTLTVREFGGIARQWVSKPGYSARMVGDCPMARENAIEVFERLIAVDNHINSVCDQLRGEYPNRQIYIEYLPGNQAWVGEPGRYAYVYKLRRKNGVYPIEKALRIS